jgi:hypothetical protein
VNPAVNNHLYVSISIYIIKTYDEPKRGGQSLGSKAVFFIVLVIFVGDLENRLFCNLLLYLELCKIF